MSTYLKVPLTTEGPVLQSHPMFTEHLFCKTQISGSHRDPDTIKVSHSVSPRTRQGAGLVGLVLCDWIEKPQLVKLSLEVSMRAFQGHQTRRVNPLMGS